LSTWLSVIDPATLHTVTIGGGQWTDAGSGAVVADGDGFRIFVNVEPEDLDAVIESLVFREGWGL
jgi:hypothetical protein